MQAYSNPKRATDAHALPDVEVFYVDTRGYCGNTPFVLPHEPGEQAMGLVDSGWYWWTCFPGCLPDSEPSGPFDTEAEALADAQDGMDESA